MLLFKIFSKAQRLSLLKKCLLGSAIITAVEFLSGCVVNLWFKMDVWDYSKMPGNIKGQVCAAYSFLWLLLSAPVVFLCNTIKTKFRIR